ncbi:MAG: hypothetical protein KA792_01740 [Bacteroidales bacterium]|nr:hypothetical protein [Bacteroidales bacterium]
MLIPYIITNLFSIGLIYLAYKHPKACILSFAGIFFIAAIVNIILVFKDSDTYVNGFGPNAYFDFYKSFIYEEFKLRTQLYVLLIAIGQFLISIFLISRLWLIFNMGINGGIIFLLAIAPLGVGSAFPASILMAIAMIMMKRRVVQLEREKKLKKP